VRLCLRDRDLGGGGGGLAIHIPGLRNAILGGFEDALRGDMGGVGQERLGPSYFCISLVLVPQNSLVWYVPSLR
jgi:hypothetical protein